VIFSSGVDGPEIKNLFLVGITEPLIGKGQATQNNQENSSQNYRFHIFHPQN